MRKWHGGSESRAFTRLDVLALLGVGVLLVGLCLPVLAGNRVRSERVSCFNNLRQLALAMQLWAADHGELFPQEVPVAQGGTKLHPLAVNAWLHYSWISNELGSPHVLSCPADTGRPAQDFSADPTKGYLHPNFRNAATSYLLSHSYSGFKGQDILAGDRNLGNDGARSCATFSAASYLAFSSANVRWGSSLHGTAGNFVFYDGHVLELSTPALREIVWGRRFADNGNFHFLTPR